ncbi:MAG: periplasmic heavy metal sensor [Nitrospirales bacterium]|nr:periplasmic heavy metal sensor [Nitrospirales bacterium]
MQNSRNLFLLISVLMLAFNTPAFAQMGHMGEGGQGMKSHHGERGHGKSIYEASCWTETLTDEQKAKRAQMRLEFKKVKLLIKAQIKVKKVELATLVTQDNPDRSAIEQKIEEVLELKREKMRAKYAYKVALRNMLTPEQRVLFDMKLLKKAYKGKGHGYKKGHGKR